MPRKSNIMLCNWQNEAWNTYLLSKLSASTEKTKTIIISLMLRPCRVWHALVNDYLLNPKCIKYISSKNKEYHAMYKCRPSPQGLASAKETCINFHDIVPLVIHSRSFSKTAKQVYIPWHSSLTQHNYYINNLLHPRTIQWDDNVKTLTGILRK